MLLSLYAARVGPHWKIGRDSALYVGLAQSLAEGHGFRFLDMPYDRMPFGLPVMLSMVWRALGPDWLAMNALMAVLALVTLWLVYRSVREIAGPWWGLIVVVLTGLSYRMVQFAGQLMSDMPAMFGFWLGFYFLQRLTLRPADPWIHAPAAGLGLAVGTAFRFSVPFVAPAFALGPWLRRRADGPGFGKRALLSALVVLPMAVMLWVWLHRPVEVRPGEASTSYWTPMAASTTARVALSQWPKSLLLLDAVLESVTTLNTGAERLLTPGHSFSARDPGRVTLLGVMLLWLGAGAWQVTRKDRGLSVLTFLCHGVGVTAFAHEPIPRYLLPVLPLLLWFAAEGLQAAWRGVRRLPAMPADAAAFPLSAPVLVVLVLLSAPSTARVLHEIRLTHTADFYAAYDRGHWKPYVEVAGWLKANATREARVLSPEDSVVTFLSQRPLLPLGEQPRPGDFLVLEPRQPRQPPRGMPDYGGRQMMEDRLSGTRRLAESGAAKEVLQCKPLTVFQVLPPLAKPPASH